jgi:hypothetical protein
MNRSAQNPKTTACFGHVAKPDAPRITDALTYWVLDAPVGALAQWQKGQAQRSPSIANGLIARAVARIFALPALLACHGDIFQADRRCAEEGARLLIAADLVAATLADHSRVTRDKIKRCVGLLFHELRRDDVPDFTLDIPAESAEAWGLRALLEGARMEEATTIAAWYRRCRTHPAFNPDGIGFYRDVAIVREALFCDLAGREFHLPDALGEDARHACMLALVLAAAFRKRGPDADGTLAPTDE